MPKHATLHKPNVGFNFLSKIGDLDQGCQMVHFQTKNPNLGKFWRAFDWEMLIYFLAILAILRTFGIFYHHLNYFTDIWDILSPFELFYGHLGYFMTIWYIFPVLVSCTKKNLATPI
jgi:hypothetical protein